jgi:hypothetical protein
VGEHELPGRRQVVVTLETVSKSPLFLATQHGDVADTLEIGIQASNRTGQGEVTVTSNDESGSSGHRFSLWFRWGF